MDDETIASYSRSLSRVAMVYHCTLEQHGSTAPGAAWGSPTHQTLGFERLSAGIDPSRPVSVNDVGCGYGGLFHYLDRRVRLAGYCGTDICEAMVAAAAANVSDPRARFVQSAMPVAEADWSIASGTFNLSAGCDDGVWRRLTEDVLRAMARRSRIGFAFSMLFPESVGEFLWGSDPEPWLRFCRDQLRGRPDFSQSAERIDWHVVVHI